ncbi:MAG TPA: hypothetical protein DG753_01800 [Clostridium sp.]|nr:hypothetical protein [Clostridium sp.]
MEDEIKVTHSIFGETISCLTSNLEVINETRKIFKSSSEEMKSQWTGTGADAYESTCNLINSKFEKAVKDLEQEIVDLIGNEKSITNEDANIAGKYNEH